MEQEGGFIPQLLTNMGVAKESFKAAVRHEVEKQPKVSGGARQADKLYIAAGFDKSYEGRVYFRRAPSAGPAYRQGRCTRRIEG